MEAINCPEGTYTKKMDAKELSDCIKCPPGSYCEINAVTNVINIKTCVEGHYCAGGASSATGTGKCKIGHYCPTGTIFPIPCPPGFFCP